MKKIVLSLFTVGILLTAISVTAQDNVSKEGCCKAKEEQCEKKDKACKAKEEQCEKKDKACKAKEEQCEKKEKTCSSEKKEAGVKKEKTCCSEQKATANVEKKDKADCPTKTGTTAEDKSCGKKK